MLTSTSGGGGGRGEEGEGGGGGKRGKGGGWGKYFSKLIGNAALDSTRGPKISTDKCYSNYFLVVPYTRITKDKSRKKNKYQLQNVSESCTHTLRDCGKVTSLIK